MKTIIFAIVGWLYFTAILVGVIWITPTLLGKVLAGTGVLVWLGSLIPCSLDDMGYALAAYLRMYGAGRAALRLAHALYLLPFWLQTPFRSFAAFDLARVYLLEDNILMAEKWIGVAEKMAVRDRWTMQFRIHFVAGKIAYLQNLYSDAHAHFVRSIELYEANKEPFGPLAEELAESQVLNHDFMARIALSRGDVKHAADHIFKGNSIRMSFPSLSGTAEAHNKVMKGLLEYSQGNVKEAEKLVIQAAHALPGKIVLIQDRNVKVMVLRALWLVGTAGAHGQFASSSEGFIETLHPLERRLITCESILIESSTLTEDLIADDRSIA